MFRSWTSARNSVYADHVGAHAEGVDAAEIERSARRDWGQNPVAASPRRCSPSIRPSRKKRGTPWPSVRPRSRGRRLHIVVDEAQELPHGVACVAAPLPVRSFTAVGDLDQRRGSKRPGSWEKALGPAARAFLAAYNASPVSYYLPRRSRPSRRRGTCGAPVLYPKDRCAHVEAYCHPRGGTLRMPRPSTRSTDPCGAARQPSGSLPRNASPVRRVSPAGSGALEKRTKTFVTRRYHKHPHLN